MRDQGERRIMKRRFFSSLVISALMVCSGLIACPAFAQNTSRTITISREAKVGSQVLAQGKYTLTFNSEKEGELIISRGDKQVAKTAYSLVELGKNASDSAVVFSANPDGSLNVKRIELKGMKVALQIAE